MKPYEHNNRKAEKTNSCFGYNERLFLEGYLSGRRGFEKITKRKRLAEIFGQTGGSGRQTAVRTLESGHCKGREGHTFGLSVHNDGKEDKE